MSNAGKPKNNSNDRAHYRICYPLSNRPVFEAHGKKHPVIDVSEQGLAISVADDGIKHATQAITGRIHFLDGDVITVTGKVLRHDTKSVILLLSAGVPLPIIMKEQRFLLQKFGNLK